MELKDILAKCDHTLLTQTATWAEIKGVCDDGMKYHTASICIPASYVKQAKEYVGDKLPICTVIGFPNGYDTTAAKCFETAEAVKNGADEIDMVIDIGSTSKEETEKVFNIHIGAPVVPDVTFEYNETTGVMLGKAFDNRVGCAAVLETMKDLKNENLDVDVVGVLSSQEEIGERGAFVTRDVVKPDIAICFEGCPADDTFTPDYFIQTAMKKGPMLRHFDRSMVTNPRFQRFSLELGRELGIPVQESVRSGGGTNGGPIHTSNGGVPVIVIGVPVRYIHSHHGFAALEDYQNSVKLAVEIIKRLNDEKIKSF